MGVALRSMGQTLVVSLEGELDLYTAESFKEAVADAFARDGRLRHLILAMNHVSFIDSSGVGAILGRYRDVKEQGGRMAVVGLQLPVKKVFEMSGMTKLISLYESEGQALASL